MRTILLILLTGLSLQFQTIAQNRWLNRGGSLGNEEALDHCNDADGNLFVTGYFALEANFGSTTLVSNGGSDVFIAKLSASGEYLWAKSFGGNLADGGVSITSIVNGNIAVHGYFAGSMTVAGQVYTAASMAEDYFVAMLNPDGDVLWLRTGGGPHSEVAYAITSDPNGNVLVTGAFKGQANIGGQMLTSVYDPVLEEASYDLYLVKYGPSGNVLWVKQGAGKFEDRGIDLVTDQLGNIYMAGQVSDTVTFGQTYNNSMYNAGFVMKIDPQGNELWMRLIGGSMVLPRSLAIGPFGQLYLAGEFLGQITFFGPQNLSATNPHIRKVFIARLDEGGNALWIRSLGSDNLLNLTRVAVDLAGEPYIAGTFRCHFTELSEPLGSAVFYSMGFRDVFCARYTQTGDLVWKHHAGGPLDDRVGGLTIRSTDRPIVSGGFQDHFSVPMREYAFNLINGVNLILPHPNSGLTYCADNRYGTYASIKALGQRDVFVGDFVDLNREFPDFYPRDPNIGCIREILDPLINNGATAISGCDSAKVWVHPQSDPHHLIGPRYTYNWSNGETNDTLWLYASTTLSLITQRIDGCQTFYDTVDVVVNPHPEAPRLSDSYGFNVQHLPDANEINLCAPNSVEIVADPVEPDQFYYWNTVGGVDASTPLTVTQTGFYDLITATPAGCTDTNHVEIYIDDFANAIQVDPRIHVHDACEQIIWGDTLHMAYADTFYISVIDSSTYWNSQYCLPYMLFDPDNVQPGSPGVEYVDFSVVGGLCNMLWARFIAMQSGWQTITIGISDVCSNLFPSYSVSRSTYVNIDFVNNPQIAGPNDLCPGDTVQLYPSGGDNYTWAGPSVVQVDPDGVAHVTEGGIYTVTSTMYTAQGCASIEKKSFQLPVREAPLVLTDPPYAIVCPYDSVLMWTVGGTGHTWYGPNGDVIGNGPTVYGFTPGPYFCTLTDSLGCYMQSDMAELVGYTTPYLTAEPGTTICQGQEIELMVFCNEGALVQWQAPLSGSGLTISVSSPGTYTCQVTNCGITATASITITEFDPAVQVLILGNDTICEGQTMQISISGVMGSVEWSDGNYGQYNSILQSGSYFASITNAEGCVVNSDTVAIVVLPAPAMPTAIDTAVCHGSPISIALQPAYGLSYVTSAGSAPIDSISYSTVNEAIALVYHLFDGSCLSEPSSITIAPIAGSGPVVVSGSLSLCPSDTLLLQAQVTTGVSVSWTTPQGAQTDSATIQIYPPEAGVYQLTIASQVCPPVDTTIVVEVLTPDSVLIPLSSSFYCANDSVLILTDLSEAVWQPSGAIGPAVYISGLGQQWAYVSGIGANGCITQSDTIWATGVALPVVDTMPDFQVCANQPFSATLGSGNGNVLWWIENGNPVADSLVFINQVIENQNIIHIISDSLCTSLPDTFNVQAIPFPLIEMLADTFWVCPNGTVQLAIVLSDSAVVTWTNNDAIFYNGLMVSVENAQPGTWGVTINNGLCAVSDSVTLTSVPLIDFSFAASDSVSICQGASITFTAPNGLNPATWHPSLTNSESIEISQSGPVWLEGTDILGCTHLSDTVMVFEVSNPIVPYLPSDSVFCLPSYFEYYISEAVVGSPNWFFNGNLLIEDNIEFYAPIPPDGGFLALIIVDTVFGCVSDTATMHLTPSPINEPIEITGPNPACTGDTVILSISPNLEGATYIWSQNGLELGIGQSLNLGEVSSTHQGPYIVSALFEGCLNKSPSYQLDVDVRPNAPFLIGNLNVCLGDEVLINAVAQAGDLVWVNPGLLDPQQFTLSSPEASLEMTAQYGVFAINEGHCVSDTTWFVLHVSQPPVFALTDTTVCLNDDLSIELSADIFASAVWNGDTSSLYFAPTTSQTVSVVAQTHGGCEVTAQAEVTMLDCDPIPTNIFTPNGDGYNDNFSLFTDGIVDQTVSIYDRWGKLVAALSRENPHWDGVVQYSKQPADPGVYYFVAELLNVENLWLKKNGFVQLMR